MIAKQIRNTQQETHILTNRQILLSTRWDQAFRAHEIHAHPV